MGTFSSDAKTILKEKGHRQHCHALDEFLKTVEKNSAIANRKVWFYKWPGIFLLTSIPLVSALLSVSVGTKGDGAAWPERMIFSLSLFLTFATILNSIFRPSERFRNACLLGIRIEAFKTEFLAALEQMETVDEQALHVFLTLKRAEFEKFQEELIGMFMPMEMSGQQGLQTGDQEKRGKDSHKIKSP